MGYEPTWQLDVVDEDHRDLAEALNAVGEYEMRAHRDDFDSIKPGDQKIHEGRVGSWHDGAIVRFDVRGGMLDSEEDPMPGVDRTPLQAALSAGYVGHGFFTNSSGPRWSWYLVPIDDLDLLVRNAERYMERRTKYAIVTDDGVPLRVNLTDGDIGTFDTEEEAQEAADVMPGDWNVVPRGEVDDD